MNELDRRRFLQATSFALAGGYAHLAFGRTPQPRPAFVESLTFEPKGLFLTWQRDPTTTMTIQWVGAEADGPQRPIWYAKKGTEEWQQVGNAKRPFPMTNRWIFRTELTGLEPDTDYIFRVGLDSAEQRFRTMPAKDTNAIQFVSGGDSGISPNSRQTNLLAAKQAPYFVLMGGDLAYENGKNPDEFFEFLQNYSLDLRDGDRRLIPMLACLGNHDVDGSYGQPRSKAPFFFSFFDGLFPDTGYACLDIGQYMSLVLLDTNHTSPVAGAQTDWLAQTLKDRIDCPNVFVFNHVPSYPSYRSFDGTSDKPGTGADSRQHWVPLFERYNVDAVFEHHDHTYKRTRPMLDGRPNEKGVLYLGDGSWGRLRKPVAADTRPYLAVTDEDYHLSVHRIEGKQQFHVALSDEGRVVDICMTTKKGGVRRG
jgi:acid phosphatase type 7